MGKSPLGRWGGVGQALMGCSCGGVTLVYNAMSTSFPLYDYVLGLFISQPMVVAMVASASLLLSVDKLDLVVWTNP